MRLFKIEAMRGDMSCSVLRPEEVHPILPPEIAGVPIFNYINQLKGFGYTERQAFYILQAWVYHAQHDLNQLEPGQRVFVEMMLRKLWEQKAAALPAQFWPGVIVIAAVAVVGAGLWLWAKLKNESYRLYPGHAWSYIMTYEEFCYQGEVWVVGRDGIAYYERGGEFGPCLVWNERNVQHVGERLDRLWFHQALVHEGRPTILYYRFPWYYWDCHYCGMLTQVGTDLYKLREGGDDPYLPGRPWARPGDRWGYPGYEGCWLKWWWI